MGCVSDLRKIVTFMRKNGVLHYKSGEVELSLSPSALKLPILKEQSAVEDMADNKPQGMDLLLWSSTPEGMEGN